MTINTLLTRPFLHLITLLVNITADYRLLQTVPKVFQFQGLFRTLPRNVSIHTPIGASSSSSRRHTP